MIETFPFSATGKRITHVRSSNSMNKKQFAQTIGISDSHLSELESGKKRLTKDVCEKISRIFPVVTYRWLQTGEGRDPFGPLAVEEELATYNTQGTSSEMMIKLYRLEGRCAYAEEMNNKFLERIETVLVKVEHSLKR